VEEDVYTQTKLNFWGQKKDFFEVCDTIFFLVNKLKKQIPIIENMIENNELKIEDFNYRKYNGCEIIP